MDGRGRNSQSRWEIRRSTGLRRKVPPATRRYPHRRAIRSSQYAQTAGRIADSEHSVGRRSIALGAAKTLAHRNECPVCRHCIDHIEEPSSKTPSAIASRTNTFGDYILIPIPAIIVASPTKPIVRVRPLDFKHGNPFAKPVLRGPGADPHGLRDASSQRFIDELFRCRIRTEAVYVYLA